MNFRKLNWRAAPDWLLRRFPPPPELHWWAARAINDRFLLGAIGVIQDDAGQVLLFYHTYRRRPWGLPSGWMVRDESPLGAVEREVREETGLEVRADRLLLIGAMRDRPMLEFVVSASLLGGTFRPSAEVSEARWWPPDEIRGLRMGRMLRVLDLALQVPSGQIGQYALSWADEQWGRRRAG